MVNPPVKKKLPDVGNSSKKTGGNSINPPSPGGSHHHHPPGGGGNPKPSPWLDPNNEPSPHATASFVEYLRWMREPNHPHKDGTKVEILHIAQEKANYQERLNQLNQRIKLLAREGVTFQVKCSWRMRVGGHRGPESILLPAFDALGMPYIPSSTLRGVARTQAIREFMTSQNISWKEAETKIAPYFGDIKTENKANLQGKVIFLDAYPLTSQQNKAGGLSMDMANNIWSWDNSSLKYSPNPNPFLSLKEPTFLIGLRLASNCQDNTVLEKVKQWLILGLQAGVGSQVNTGYGEVITAGKVNSNTEFYKIEFSLEGQLIHGAQKFTQWTQNNSGQWQMRGKAEAEVRPTAFKSVLRYWFRVFASGVLTIQQVQKTEAQIFGGINPDKQYGYLKVNILNGKVVKPEPRPNMQGKNDDCGEQQGTLVLSLSSETPSDQKESLKTLCKHLTWFLFNMGGIGQGARRPCYSRQTRDRAPWFRGCSIYLDNDEDFWTIPNNVQGFKKQFQQRLKTFYTALNQITGQSINPQNLRVIDQVSPDHWNEAADRTCQIFVCAGTSKNNKPYALSVLHGESLKINSSSGRKDYDGNLCGKVVRGVKPSPVWIADLGDYQIVTVFGATVNPRQNFINELKSQTSPQNIAQLFPLS